MGSEFNGEYREKLLFMEPYLLEMEPSLPCPELTLG